MTKLLHISDKISLPLDAVTRRMAILAMSGAGKSSLARRIAEEMYRHGLPWVAVDPKGDWAGIRIAGEGPGLPIPIFGGSHGDIELDPKGGAYIAKLIIDQRLTCVLDVSDFATDQEMLGFLADFGETLLKHNREPRHIFGEEMDEYAPQQLDLSGNAPRCLRVWKRVGTKGRTRGLGITQITQRSAALNKAILYQSDVLFALRMGGEGDRKAVRGWTDHHAGGKELVDSLPTLADGEGWVSSPGWLRRTERVRFIRGVTFDMGATPVIAGGKRVQPKTLADVDLGAIRTAMIETVERMKANDPVELKKRITELEKQVRKPAAAAAAPAPAAKTVEVPAITKQDRARLEKAIAGAEKSIARLDAAGVKLADPIEALGALRDNLQRDLMAAHGIVRELRGALDLKPAALVIGINGGVRPERAATEEEVRAFGLPPGSPVRVFHPPRVANGPGDPSLGTGSLRTLLIALAQRPQGLTRRQITARSGLSTASSTFRNNVAEARGKGWITENAEPYRITDDGVAALGSYEPLPEGEKLREYWLHRLGDSAEAKVLKAIVDAYPNELTREEVGERAGVSTASSTFRNGIAHLRNCELILGKKSFKASLELFE